ncbi:hypothetical protein HED50_14405 [Ochrobactrum oryzae]|nr:hypothetical protein [Brucella oryzae]
MFSGNNTYSGVTALSAGTTLQLGNGGTAGNVAANITLGNATTLISNHAQNAPDTIIGGTISGGGTFKTRREYRFVHANTYSGGLLFWAEPCSSAIMAHPAVMSVMWISPAAEPYHCSQ